MIYTAIQGSEGWPTCN